MSEKRETSTIDPRTLIEGIDESDGVPVLPTGIIDPHEFFDRLTHRDGDKAETRLRIYGAGDMILPQGGHVDRLLMLLEGEVELAIDGKLISTYLTGRDGRNGAWPIISAADYFYSTPSSYAATALAKSKVVEIDTRLLRTLGKKGDILLVCRNLLLFSDMAVAMREKLEEEFERTGLPCFAPEVSEGLKLRLEPGAFESHYLDFALRAMADLMAGRNYRTRAEMRSTAIVALPRQMFPLTTFKNF